jgi:peroxiredoxin-like protein
MEPLPHHYVTSACSGTGDPAVITRAAGLPECRVTSPPEFGGPEGSWSPETMLVAAVADCLILTFRAIAQLSKMEWHTLECRASGTLDRVDHVTQFTRIDLHARLAVPPHADLEQARRLLEKAERQCLISNSLKAPIHLEIAIETAAPATGIHCA